MGRLHICLFHFQDYCYWQILLLSIECSSSVLGELYASQSFFLFCFCNSLSYMGYFINFLPNCNKNLWAIFLSLLDFVFRNKVGSLQQLQYYKHLCCEVPLFDFSSSSAWMHGASFLPFSLNSDSLFKCMATLMEICMGLWNSGWLMVMEWMCEKFVWDFKFLL